MAFDRWLLRLLPLALGGCLLAVYLRYQARVRVASEIVQDRAAEEIFKKIEERIEKAKTLRIRFSWQHDDFRDRDVQGQSGVLLVKTGNKAWYQTKDSMGHERWAISNGRRMCSGNTSNYDQGIVAGERRYDTGPTSKELEKDLRRLVSRPGLPLFTFSTLAFRFEEATPKWIRASDFKSVETGGKTRALSYRLSAEDESRSMDVIVWYDPESLQLLKRKTSFFVKPQDPLAITETYSEFIFDADIPEEKFKLPSD